MDATITSMKITLAENPKLIPSTPPLPATLEGSLQPSQAITAGAFAKTAPNNEARKSLIRHSVLFRTVAQKISGIDQDVLNNLRRGRIVHSANFALPINQ